MIVLLILLMIASITLFIIKAKSPSAYWMASVLLGWFFSMAGFLLFTSKYGGFYYNVNIILFFNDYIRNLLLLSPISIDDISRMISMGRSLFIFSLIGLSLSLFYNKTFRNTWKIYVLNTVLPLINILFYDPIIYRWVLSKLDRDQTYIISLITRIWLIASTLIAVSIIIVRYKKVAVPWIKKQLKLILLGIFGLIIFYFYLIFMGPLQVTDIRTFYFLYSDFSNFNPPLTLFEWYIGIGFTGITSAISFISIWKYTDVEKQLGKSDLRLERKLKTANMGVHVFTHAIKNQLIMTQLLVNQTSELIKEQEPELQASKIETNLLKASEVISQTLNRLDQLYSSFKTTHLQLKPIDVRELISKTLERIKVVPCHIDLQYKENQDTVMILADQFHLSEAVYNILINAFEAIEQDKQGLVTLSTCVQYNWLIIKIEDTGSGIHENQLSNIFDPFFTNKNTTKNWGVGLSYSKQVVYGHFGHIDVQSTLNKGSTFSILLPVYSIDTHLTQS